MSTITPVPEIDPFNEVTKMLPEIEIDLDVLRSRVEEAGVAMRLEKRKQHYETHRDDPTDLPLEGTKAEKYLSFFGRHALPFKKTAIQDMLQMIVELSQETEMEELDLLTLPKWSGSRGKGKRQVSIVPSSTTFTLQQNTKRWLPDLIEASVDDDPGEEEVITEYDVVSVLVNELRLVNPNAFRHVCLTELQTKPKKLNAFTQIAMCNVANINYMQLEKDAAISYGRQLQCLPIGGRHPKT